MQNKQAITATYGKTPGSYLNTVNPFSNVFGAVDRVPEWWMGLFPQDSKSLAHLTFKAGACSLLAAGLVGAARGVAHLNRMAELGESDNSAKKLDSQISTTFNTKMQGKKASDGKVVETPTLSWTNALGVPTVIGATLLASALSYSAVDSFADKRRNNALAKAIDNKSNALKDVIQARAMIARDNMTDDKMNQLMASTNSDDLYVKQANVEDVVKGVTRGGLATAGLIGSVVLIASALGGYEYFKATNENNIRYRALKTGLGEYAKQKSFVTPISTLPTDAKEYFKAIDADKKPVNMRKEEIAYTDELNKPVAIEI